MRLALLAAALAAAGAAEAAAIDLSLVDASGKPLPDAVALLEPVGAKAAVTPVADVEIAQAKRRFHPRVTVVTVGSKISFPNFDAVRHHVYSFSAIKTFELKLYAGVPAEPVLFDKPGVAVLGCNIHDTMAAWVVVSDTPWYARSADTGKARIDNVPAGSYQLHLWHPGLAPGVEPPPVALTVGSADIERSAQIAVSAQP
ncbi:MAG: methylamine utilization protein [Proteobacteria bacterium]|nr:methylamine utilization protein [Pseudomonadota bacterium]